MAKVLKIWRNLILFLAICIPTICTIYVPEHANNQLPMDTLEMKPEEEYNYNKHTINESKTEQQQHLRQSGNKYLLLNINDGQQSAKTSTEMQRHHTSYDKNDDVVLTYNLNRMQEENLEAQPTSFEEKQSDDDELSTINNDDLQSHSSVHSRRRQRRQLSDFLIAPNTRWCGRGNSANGTYNHLGGATMADKCCRTHDHCKVYIPAMSNRFDLFNYRPYTLSHCNCDRRFRTCLKMASDEDANTIGKLFFNLVQTQCFILIKEEICTQRAADGTCDKKHFKQKAYLRNNKKF